MTNLFKDISPGENPPQEINVVVEIPKGASNKYEYNEEEGHFELDRTLFSPMYFPFEYGFIPQTESGDGDSLDIVLIASRPTFPGCLVKCRPVGILMMSDEKGVDNKIIAVPAKNADPRLKNIEEIEDVEKHLKEEIELFFSDYKKLEKEKYKLVKIEGWEGREKAEEIINKSIEKYADKNK